MHRSGLVLRLAFGLVLAVAATGCGTAREPIRIGVLVDCTGLFGSVHDGLLANAELPFLERGGHLVDGAHGVVAEARAGGRVVRLVEGCTESGVYDRLIAETRRLVEQEHVDVVVGPVGDPDGIILRDYLRLHPEVTGVIATSTSQATTLRRPARNVFRFTPDGAQQSAGLGTYAYRTLGWRRARIIDDGFSFSWDGAAGFAAEFCALGGTIVGRREAPPDDPARAAAKLPPDADGTVVMLSGLSDPTALFRRLARDHSLSRTVLTWKPTIGDPRLLRADARLLASVVLASDTPDDRNPAFGRFEHRFRRFFPAQPVGFATGIGLYFGNAVAATLDALDAVHGDTGRGQRRLRRALARLELDAPEGRIRLDRNRQAIVPNYLVRVQPSAGSGMTLGTIRTVTGVEQTFGGALSSAPEPSANGTRCRRGPVPAWAR